MGRNSIVDDTNPIWWHLVEFVQIENECRNSTLCWNCTIWRFHQKKAEPDYHRLKTMVKRSIDQKLRLRNFDARHGRIETGAVGKNRKGLSGVGGGKGSCYQWKEKGQCSKGDQCSFQHESNDRAQKPDHNPATPPEPSLSRGRSVSRKRCIWGKSNHGSILRKPCRYYLKDTCTRSSCEYWHPPECRFCKDESCCKTGDRCSRITRLMNTQIKSWEKRPLPKKEGKATTRMLWLLWKFYRKWVVPRKTWSYWILKEANSPGETRCEESWDRFKKYGSLSLRSVKQVSGEKGPSLGKIQVKHHQRTPYGMKFDRSQEETERQQRHKHTSSQKKTKLHSTRPRKSGYSRRQQKSRRKESLWWTPQACTWSAWKILTPS